MSLDSIDDDDELAWLPRSERARYREVLQRAMEMVRANTGYRQPTPISPQAHDAVNQVLERPKGTPVTYADLAQAQSAVYEQASPEQRQALYAEVMRRWQGGFAQ